MPRNAARAGLSMSRTRTARRPTRRIRLNRRLPSSRTVGWPSWSSWRSRIDTSCPPWVTPDPGAASNVARDPRIRRVPTRGGAFPGGRTTRQDGSDPTEFSPSSSHDSPTSASQPSGPVSLATRRARQARTSRSREDATAVLAAAGELPDQFAGVVVLPSLVRLALHVFVVQPDQEIRELAPDRLGPEHLGQVGQVHQPVRVPRGPVLVGAVGDPEHRVVGLSRLVQQLAEPLLRPVLHVPSSPGPVGGGYAAPVLATAPAGATITSV